MYEDEKEEVIHDTLANKESETFEPLKQTDYLLVKHLRAIVQEEIAKRFDDGPGVDNDIEELINDKLDKFLDSHRLEERVQDITKNVLDDCYVETNTTSYITY